MQGAAFRPRAARPASKSGLTGRGPAELRLERPSNLLDGRPAELSRGTRRRHLGLVSLPGQRVK